MNIRTLAAIAALSISLTAHAEPEGEEWGWLEDMTCTGATVVAAAQLSESDPEHGVYLKAAMHFADRLGDWDLAESQSRMFAAYEDETVGYPELMEVANGCAIQWMVDTHE